MHCDYHGVESSEQAAPRHTSLITPDSNKQEVQGSNNTFNKPDRNKKEDEKQNIPKSIETK